MASAPTRFGQAQLYADSIRPDGRVVAVDGIAQSYVDPYDPLYLAFDYAQWVATVIDSAKPTASPLRALHLGGAAMTLARYIGATRPGSAQVVVESDQHLVEFVDKHLPLPADSGITVTISDARAGIEQCPDAGFDLVINDAFAGLRMPPEIAGTGLATQAARVLAPDGIYVVNVADLEDFAQTRAQAATLASRFSSVCIVAAATVVTAERRFLNAVLAATNGPVGLPITAIEQAAIDHRAPISPIYGASLGRVIEGVAPLER